MDMRRSGAAVLIAPVLVAAGLVTVLAGTARAADRPDPATCAAMRPHRFATPTGSSDPHGDLRVVGVQYRQDVSAVATYASFRTRIRCVMEDLVVPQEVPGRPTLVVFNEDIGLMTLATGARGAAVRAQSGTPAGAPAGDAAPVGVAAALGTLNAAYAPQIAAATALLGPVDPRKQVFLGATDTLVRAFSQTFSDIATDYGVYVVASNNQARYRETHDPAEVAQFGDPELEPGLSTAYVPTTSHVANTTYLWGPSTVHADAPDGERNLLARNEKVPLTSIESTVLALDPGPSTGAAGLANLDGAVVAGHHLGFATSLPAFVYGYPFGRRPAGLDPCADTSLTYMACLDSLGVDTLIQAEANPGRWTGAGSADPWQPLEWMSSAWRAVADPTVHFRYAVNPMMVGNLLDLPFDGQSAILARSGGSGAHYVGDGALLAEDIPADAVYAGTRPGFLALAPWVAPDASRDVLRAEGARLAPGSRDPEEDDYLETAVVADLTPAGTAASAAPPPVSAAAGTPAPAPGAVAPATTAPTRPATPTRRAVRTPRRGAALAAGGAATPMANRTLATTGGGAALPLLALGLLASARLALALLVRGRGAPPRV